MQGLKYVQVSEGLAQYPQLIQCSQHPHPPTHHLSCPPKLQVCDKVRALSTTPALRSQDLGTNAPKHFPLHGSDLGSLCGHCEAGHLSLDTKGLWPCEVRRHLLELVKTHTGK